MTPKRGNKKSLFGSIRQAFSVYRPRRLMNFSKTVGQGLISSAVYLTFVVTFHQN